MTQHPLEDIHGVDRALAQRFAGVGIASCEELLAAVAGGTGGIAATVRGVSDEQLVQSFVPQARFLLAGAGEALAGALVALRIRRLADLVAADADALRTRLAERLDPPPDRAALVELQLEAARQLMTGLVLLEVRDARTRAPIAGAELVLAQPGISPFSGAAVRTSDAAGVIVTPRLRAGEAHTGTLFADGYRYAAVGLQAGPGAVRRLVVRLRAGRRAPMADEALSGRMLVAGGRVAVRNGEVALDEVPAGETLVVTRLGAREAQLTRMTRRREGVVLRVDNASVPSADLPDGVRRGDVVVVEADRSLRRLRADAAQRARRARFGELADRVGGGR